jgi:alkyldihydroxyacetonephosphate synthase
MTFVSKLEAALGKAQVVSDPSALQDRRHDYWVLSHFDDIDGRPAPAPLCAVRPRHAEDVAATLRLCAQEGIGLVPFGLGSGVCGGVLAASERVLLDMSAMNALRFIDEKNLLAGFDAGHNGLAAEDKVAARGLTIGHWPQSIALSSVGGWIATRASGQLSTGYGNIEDLVHSVEAVLPDASVVTLGRAPRAAAGPDLRHILMGSEGTLGVVTGVTLSLRRQPEARALSAYHVRAVEEGFEAQREILQSGWAPVVLRQYDAVEAKRGFPDHARENKGLLLAVHEGPRTRVDAEQAAVAQICEGAGLAAALVAAVERWLERRNHVPHWKDYLAQGVMLDTVEVSASWSAIARVYHEAVRRLQEVPGCVNASAHSSHAYRSGINLYFTFAVAPGDKTKMRGAYEASWRAIMEATAEAGGGIAHHHGIGRVRRAYLHHDLGSGGLALLRTLKRALDPKGIMNPGVLIPDA